MEKTKVYPPKLPICYVIAEMVKDMKKICRSQKTPTTWREKYWSAVPYIDALSTLSNKEDKYGFDNGTYLINYLLSNLGNYRGDRAKELKMLLKDILKD